jgi:hypothetical protein
VTAGAALFWSLKGEVACAHHAPAAGSPRWAGERWQRVPEFVFTDLRKRLQCQHCEQASGRPYRHERREISVGGDNRDVAHDKAAAREMALLMAQIDSLRRDYDSLVRQLGSDPHVADVLRRLRDHVDSLRVLLDAIRDRGIAARRP